jgi:hypothetical protein
MSFFEAAGAAAKISSSLKSNHHRQIKLATIGKTHFTTIDLVANSNYGY